MTAARVIETLEDTAPSRATERTSGVCIHPVQSPLTQRTSKQSGREGGWGGPTGCMFVAPNQPHFRGRKAAGSSPCAPEEEAETIASLPGVWMLVSARMSSLHAVHRKALFTSPSVPDGWQQQRRHRRWEVVSSFVMQCFPHGLLTLYQT